METMIAAITLAKTYTRADFIAFAIGFTVTWTLLFGIYDYLKDRRKL